MTVIEKEPFDALRRQLRAHQEKLNWLASYDTPNSERLRDEITSELAAITARLDGSTATEAEPTELAAVSNLPSHPVVPELPPGHAA